MNEFLEAAAGYVPLFQSFLWLIFLLVIAILFRVQISELFESVKRRIESGAKVSFAGLEIGPLVTRTADLMEEVETYGNPDQFKLLFKAQGKRWKKSTKALELPNGCLVQVTTERQSRDGEWANAEALVFVPNVRLVESEDRVAIIEK